MIMVDLQRPETFNLDVLFQDCDKFAGQVHKVLVGNKTDDRAVSRDEAEEYAAGRNVPYLEMSVQLDENVDEVLAEAIRLAGADCAPEVQDWAGATIDLGRRNASDEMERVCPPGSAYASLTLTKSALKK